jgi:hypothetical protein
LKARAANADGTIKGAVAITIASYNAYLLVHAVSGVLPEHESEILTEIADAGLALNRESYTALIMGQTDAERRRALWEVMTSNKSKCSSQNEIMPTIASVKEVLKVSDGDMALRVVDFLWALPPPDSSSGSDSSSDRGGGRHSKREVSSSGSSSRPGVTITPNTPIRGVTITPSSSRPQWSHVKAAAAASVAVTVRPRRNIQRLQPSVEVCMLALGAIAREGRSKDCLALISRMRARHLEPTQKCYRIALSSFHANSTDWESAVHLLIQMQVRGFTNSLPLGLSVALACCRTGERHDLVKKLLNQASLSARFHLAPVLVETSVVAAFYLSDAAWLRTIMARRRPPRRGEDAESHSVVSLHCVPESDRPAFAAFVASAGAGIDTVH